MKNLLVLTCLNQVRYLDPVIDDWAHINAPTLVFGGAEDSLPGSGALFRERMKFVAQSIPNGNGRLTLIPGLGHVPHMEAPAKTFPRSSRSLERDSRAGRRRVEAETDPGLLELRPHPRAARRPRPAGWHRPQLPEHPGRGNLLPHAAAQG